MTDLKIISQLREMTGAGMSECSQVLKEANNDINQAVEILRKKGSAKAAKKSERVTKEGVIAIKIATDHKSGSLAAIYCETDFVARNADFVAFVNNLVQSENPEQDFNSKKEELILKIGENITFGRADFIQGAYVSGYLHANRKVAGLVSFSKEISEELAHDIAMQVVAGQPQYNQPENIPVEELEKEKEIYREQLKNEDKPEQIREKIVAGKLAKYYEEVCLLNQKFIKDDNLTVKQLLVKVGEDVQIERFVRYQI